MPQLKVRYVGLDVHKDSIVIAVAEQGRSAGGGQHLGLDLSGRDRHGGHLWVGLRRLPPRELRLQRVLYLAGDRRRPDLPLLPRAEPPGRQAWEG